MSLRARPARSWLWVLAAVLFGAAGDYLGRGFGELLIWGHPTDLRLRWVEHRYLMGHGQDPFDIYFRYQPQGPVTPPKPITRDTTIDPELGGVPNLAYPPWSYPLGTVILWPPWPAVRYWAGLLDAVALALVVAWAWNRARPLGRAEATVVVAVCLSCADSFTVLRLGQLAIYILGFLLAAMLLERRGRDISSGLMLGLAMIKPTIAAPFVLVPLIRGRWRSVAICIALVGAGSAVAWIRTGVNPLEMVQQMVAVAEQVEIPLGEPGPVTWLIGLGLSASAASKIAGVAFLIPCIAAMWWCRGRPVEVMYAIAAVTAQVWTHHKGYDSVVLVLMLVPLLTLALAPPRRWWLLGLAGLVTLSVLQLGLSHLLSPGLRVAAQTVVWIVGLVVYLVLERRGDPSISTESLTLPNRGEMIGSASLPAS
jgi:Glycosyltransferase family 87